MRERRRRGRRRSQWQMRERKVIAGFTLVELLVVVAVITILAALLLPVLAKAKWKTRAVVCLNNLRQLGICWHLYAVDNEDVLVPNNSNWWPPGSYPIWGTSWCQDTPRVDQNPWKLQQGLLYPYNRSVEIYHCPADLSKVKPSMYAVDYLPMLRFRSYSLSQSVNGKPEKPPPGGGVGNNWPCWRKFSQIRRPGPSQLFTFIDEHEETMWVSAFHLAEGLNIWIDLPSDRHNPGAGISFADGHCEKWRWNGPKVFVGPAGMPVTPVQKPDFLRVQNAMKSWAAEFGF